MKITPENATALIIDLQEKIVPAISEPERLLERNRFLLDGLAVFDVPVVSTRQYPKGLGETLPEIADAMKNATVFDKTTFSCLATDEIRAAFVADPRPNVILAGIEAHICVLGSPTAFRRAIRSTLKSRSSAPSKRALFRRPPNRSFSS